MACFRKAQLCDVTDKRGTSPRSVTAKPKWVFYFTLSSCNVAILLVSPSLLLKGEKYQILHETKAQALKKKIKNRSHLQKVNSCCCPPLCTAAQIDNVNFDAKKTTSLSTRHSAHLNHKRTLTLTHTQRGFFILFFFLPDLPTPARPKTAILTSGLLAITAALRPENISEVLSELLGQPFVLGKQLLG